MTCHSENNYTSFFKEIILVRLKHVFSVLEIVHLNIFWIMLCRHTLNDNLQHSTSTLEIGRYVYKYAVFGVLRLIPKQLQILSEETRIVCMGSLQSTVNNSKYK